MTGIYSIQNSVARLTREPYVKSGGTKLVGENQTQQFETGLSGLKLLVWFALGVNRNQFELVWVEQQVDCYGPWADWAARLLQRTATVARGTVLLQSQTGNGKGVGLT